MKNRTKIAVIGAGHAGVEAALASARLGIDTVLFTLSLDTIANLPCNPSIGGTGKGHLVYEIDALGGEMGRAADKVTLQSRTLNLGKGAAVHSKRIQADRVRYQQLMKHTIECTDNLRLIQAEVTDISISADSSGKRRINSLTTCLGETWECECVVICTGTYLKGQIFVGNITYESGPDNVRAATNLSAALAREGIRLMRFKTGTPARIKRASIDFSQLEDQPGESKPLPYSADTPEDAFDCFPQLSCHILYTTPETHRIISENISRSAMYSGNIHGTGARYCPSIEDKIVRFADKPRHQLFVEPMGEDSEEMYLQGFSTSMPTDVQHKMLASLPGFKNAEIMRYAYAIEYDCCDPTQLGPTLEFHDISGLFGAGQFNGTSGYEEAAAQGLIAGINAAMKIKNQEPLILERSNSYIGTLIDDLITKGTDEPYRMMTSRSEYRLLLRQDNADIRLTPLGYRAGLIADERYNRFEIRRTSIEAEKKRLESTYLSPAEVNTFLVEIGESTVSSGVSLADLVRRPGLSYNAVLPLDPKRPKLSRMSAFTVGIDIKYEGYIKREIAEAARHAKLEGFRLPDDVDYKSIRGLRTEASQKLTHIRPRTVGQASRISGVNPADITVLLIHFGKK